MAKEIKLQYVYYSTQNNVTNSPNFVNNWEDGYQFLTAEDAALVAVQWNNMKQVRIDKLINHKSPKFNCMRTRKICVMKHFSDTPITYIPAQKQLMAEARQLIESWENEEL